MFYHLLYPLSEQFGGFNVVRYITFRTAAATLTALFISFLVGPWLIRKLAELRVGNTMRPEAQEAYGIQARNLARLDDAGLKIAMGTDGNVYWGAHIEMEDMVAAGMSPADVIVASTANSAEAMGITDAGTIEVGKRADFVVLEANPLDDITNTRRIVDVYLQGARVDRSL